MGAWSYNIRADFAQNSPVYPQDCGSRTGVYSATVTGSIPGIGFGSDAGMTFSALPYTPHELENARHLYELPRDDNKTVVRCAAFQRGVGGGQQLGRKASCGCLPCGGEGNAVPLCAEQTDLNDSSVRKKVVFMLETTFFCYNNTNMPCNSLQRMICTLDETMI